MLENQWMKTVTIPHLYGFVTSWSSRKTISLYGIVVNIIATQHSRRHDRRNAQSLRLCGSEHFSKWRLVAGCIACVYPPLWRLLWSSRSFGSQAGNRPVVALPSFLFDTASSASTPWRHRMRCSSAPIHTVCAISCLRVASFLVCWARVAWCSLEGRPGPSGLLAFCFASCKVVLSSLSSDCAPRTRSDALWNGIDKYSPPSGVFQSC